MASREHSIDNTQRKLSGSEVAPRSGNCALCLQLKPKAGGASPAIAGAGREAVITVSGIAGQTWVQTITVPEVRCANQTYRDDIYGKK